MPDSPRSPMESPRMGGSTHDEHHSPSISSSAPLAGPVTPTTPTAPNSHYSSISTLVNPSSAGGLTVPSSRPTTASSGDHQPREQHPRDVSTSTHSSSRHHDSSRDKDKATADNPYRSFRVTLEDPCHKVLPAALKKYKINDDWRQYALFICYGNTGEFGACLLGGEARERRDEGARRAERSARRREKSDELTSYTTTTNRALPSLRRKAPPPLPTAQRIKQQSRLHAPSYQGHQIPHRRSLSKARRSTREARSGSGWGSGREVDGE